MSDGTRSVLEREEHRAKSYARAMVLLDDLYNTVEMSGVCIADLRVKMPPGRYGDSLVVVRGVDVDGVKVVAFHVGAGPGEALRGALERVRQGTLKWKEDEYGN